ncbi:hypothetical protein VNO78_01037 [Psophocarpus tetragonolobus]|uniref:Uncharacterized protein n=1 Tax=Psophocarpus tetragonolobus TaxID=3891 RepID=A0AAN9T164_PSOTE
MSHTIDWYLWRGVARGLNALAGFLQGSNTTTCLSRASASASASASYSYTLHPAQNCVWFDAVGTLNLDNMELVWLAMDYGSH